MIVSYFGRNGFAPYALRFRPYRARPVPVPHPSCTTFAPYPLFYRTRFRTVSIFVFIFALFVFIFALFVFIFALFVSIFAKLETVRKLCGEKLCKSGAGTVNAVNTQCAKLSQYSQMIFLS